MLAITEQPLPEDAPVAEPLRRLDEHPVAEPLRRLDEAAQSAPSSPTLLATPYEFRNPLIAAPHFPCDPA